MTPADRRAHRAAGGAGRAGQPARPLVQRRGGARLRAHRPHRGAARRRAARCRGPDRRACDHEPVHDPHRGGADPGRRAGLRHLLPAAVRADRLPRHRDRRRRGQRGHGPAAAPGVGQPGPGDQPVHQLARRLLQRADRDLRHDAVHPAGRRHHLHGPGVVGGRGAAGGGRAGPAGGAAGTRRCCCTSRRARPRAPCPTWPSRPRRWPGPGRDVEEILSRHTGHPVAKIRIDTDRNKTFSAREAVEYGLADEVITTREADQAAQGVSRGSWPSRAAA